MKIYLILFVLLLSGCSGLKRLTTQLDLPQQMVYSGKGYNLSKQSDLGSIARYVYWQNKQNAQNWQSGLELLHDRTTELSINERIELRKRFYAKSAFIKQYDFYQVDGFLYGYVIYAPTELNKGWQVDVLKGKDISNCGFVQYQYSVKVNRTSKIKRMSEEKLLAYLHKYVAEKELGKLMNLPWKWQCTLPNAKGIY